MTYEEAVAEIAKRRGIVCVRALDQWCEDDTWFFEEIIRFSATKTTWRVTFEVSRRLNGTPWVFWGESHRLSDLEKLAYGITDDVVPDKA